LRYFDVDGVADRPAKSAMDAKKGLGSNLVVSLLGAHMVNDNWKSQDPSYQLPARDVGFRLLGRRFSANKQSVSIKIFHPAQILAGSQPVIYSSRSLDLLRPGWTGLRGDARFVKMSMGFSELRPVTNKLGYRESINRWPSEEQLRHGSQRYYDSVLTEA
jgi:hypothetical protein